MIEAKYGLVSGSSQMVYVDSEWNVDCTTFDKRLIFSTEMGPLAVATVMSNFDTITTKPELRNIASSTYLSLTADSTEHCFEELEKKPNDYSQKEFGDVFDALVRRRTFPLRENVYHIGKMSFRKILFVQYPSDFDAVNEIISGIEISPDYDEEYVRESYFRTYYEKYNRLHGGTKNGVIRTRASEETIARLNEKIVEVKTRATQKNKQNDMHSTDIAYERKPDKIPSLDARKHIYVRDSEVDVEENKYSEPELYEMIVYDFVEDLDNGELTSLKSIIKLLEEKGFNPSPVDVDAIILKLAKIPLIKKTITDNESENKKVVYKRFNK